VTTEQPHTPEPWEVSAFVPGEGTREEEYMVGKYGEAGANQLNDHVLAIRIRSEGHGHIASTASIDLPRGTAESNARRIMACVNFCAGHSTEWLLKTPGFRIFWEDNPQ
jgi:hypothetical protein